jgi:N-acylneuraminate cytidylyltransferase
MTKSIAIIPARGGSKRIPKKNIKLFHGKPIISYTIEAALNSKLFDVVMVSTDDSEIAEIAKNAGAEIPFMRSSENSSDFASTGQVLEEVLKIYLSLKIKFDFACCIYPTAPFVTKDILLKGFNLLHSLNYKSVFPVTQYSYPIQRSLRIDENDKVSMVWNEFIDSRSQDLEKRYHDAGLFYWFTPDEFLKNKELFTENSGCIILKETECHDIDNLEDWYLAELKFKLINSETILKKASKLILGTAQIGMHYGVNNSSELLTVEQSLEILNCAKENGIIELDTANAYGESERIIGMYNRCASPFIVNTKVVKTNFVHLRTHVQKLLIKLGVKKINTLYIHKINEFIDNSHVLSELVNLKNEGIIDNIGVAVYTNNDIDFVMDFNEINIVQVPFNLLDNENVRGEKLRQLKISKKEVHVRSIFLQGLIFANPNNLPEYLSILKPYLIQLNKISSSTNYSIANIAFQYALSKPYIDKILFGIDNINQLKSNINEIHKEVSPEVFRLIDHINVKEIELLNPGNWQI